MKIGLWDFCCHSWREEEEDKNTCELLNWQILYQRPERSCKRGNNRSLFYRTRLHVSVCYTLMRLLKLAINAMINWSSVYMTCSIPAHYGICTIFSLVCVLFSAFSHCCCLNFHPLYFSGKHVFVLLWFGLWFEIG